MYNLYIRDANFRRIGEITDFIKLDLIPRFNAVGSFTLDLPTDCAAARELIKPKYGIIVKKDGQTIFSGTVTSRKRAFSSSGDTTTISGKDDNAYLAYRIAYPETNLNFDLQDYDVRTGLASTVMAQYVDYNCGPNALTHRQVMTIGTDLGLGSTVTGRARFDNLLDLLSSLALKGGGLGFNVLQKGNELEFRVYQPIDKTRTAFFSPLMGNLSAFDYSNDNPEANLLVVGGGGEGTARILLWKQDSASVAKYGRFEAFIDQRNTTDGAELYKSLDEELVNKAEQNSFNFTPIDTPQLAFGRDYWLGDKVSIVLTQPNEIITKETLNYFISFYQSGYEETVRVRKIQEQLEVIQDIVREVNISITPDGETISPLVGTQQSNSNAVLGIFDKMKKISKRLSNLERR